MSAVVDFVDDLVDNIPILESVWDAVKDFYDWQWQNIMKPALEFTFSLLGIKDEDVIGTQVSDQRLLGDDDDLAAVMTQVALEHQSSGKGILEILTMKTANMRQQYTQYYNYGVDSYYAKLPTTNMHATKVNDLFVKAAIQAELGQDVGILTTALRTPTKQEWIYSYMRQHFGYTSWNNLFTYSDALVYNIQFMDYNFATNMYDLTVMKVSDNSTRVITIPSYEIVRHYVATYYLIGSPLEVNYWTYKMGVGLHPNLDVANSAIGSLEMMPIVELRNNMVNVNQDKTTRKYLETKEILSYLGIDVDVIIETLESNPDIASVNDAYIYFGLQVNESNPITDKMLYTLFDFLYYDTALVNEGVFTVTFNEGNFNAVASWRKQERSIEYGNFGPIGSFKSEVKTVTEFVDNNNGEGAVEATSNVLYIRKQENHYVYSEYRIYDLTSVTAISRQGLVGMVSADLLNPQLTIPLSKYFIDMLTPIEQMQLLRKSLRLSIYAATITHLEYYETKAFFDLIQIVVIIIGIVLFILSLPAGGSGGAAWMAFAETMLIYTGVLLAFNYVLSKIDAPWAKMLLIVVAAAMAYYTGGASLTQTGFFVANEVSIAITQYTQTKFDELTAETSSFHTAYQKAQEVIDSKVQSFADYISTDFVAGIAKLPEVKAFIEGPDLNIYKAVAMQYDWELVKGQKAYQTMFDYDKYYYIGIV